jgi:hypothetical protein
MRMVRLLLSTNRTRNRKVVGSTPTSGSTESQVRDGVIASIESSPLPPDHPYARSRVIEERRMSNKRGSSWWVVVYAGRHPLTGKK